MKQLGKVAVFGALLLLSACDEQDAKVPYLDNMDQVWGQMFAPYGLYPLYPVRTDIQPGDVIVLCKKKPPIAGDAPAIAKSPGTSASAPEPEPDKVKGEWVRLFSLKEIGAALEDYQKTRMNFHSFARSASAQASDPLGPVTGKSPYGLNKTPDRLGFASFPSILSYNQKRTDFGAGIPIGTTVVGGGSSIASQGFYTLEIPSAEYAHAPHSVLQRALLATVGHLQPYEMRTLRNAKKALDAKSCIEDSLSVVGDVYYTRRLTVSMGDSFAAALSARAAYQLPIDSTRNAVYEAIGAYATGASAPSTPASTPSVNPQRDLAKLLIDIDAVYKNADANSKLGFAGVKVGFAKSGGKGVSLDYSFQTPVAFGMRLFPLSIEQKGNALDLAEDLAVTSSRNLRATTSDTPQAGELVGEEAASQPRKTQATK